MKIPSFFKTFAFFAAAAVTTACSSDDSSETTGERAIAPNTIHVSVGAEIATGSTRATYEYADGTGSDANYHLVFETGDKLHLELSGDKPGSATGWMYTGVLEYQGDGVFSGDMTVYNNQTAYASDISQGLVNSATDVNAILLPKGYESSGFITYNGSPYFDYKKAFATGYRKNSVAPVCQMYADSWTDNTPGKLTLEPQNPVIYFTVNGLAAETEYPVQLDLTSDSWTGTYTVSGTATSDASGIATFCIGIGSYGEGDATTYALKIDNQTLNLGTKTLAKGKVYNLSRFVVSDAAKEVVDLGLTVNWCKCNVGARSETDWGLLFAWGRTRGYSSVLGDVITEGRSWKAVDGYNFNNEDMYPYDHSALPSKYDAACVNLGSEYFIPYNGYWQELINNCTWEFTDDYKGTGVAGYIATSKIEGYTDKSIFLPAVPMRNQDEIFYSANFKQMSYWSQNNDDRTIDKASYFVNNTSGVNNLTLEEIYRYYGLSVRAVKLK